MSRFTADHQPKDRGRRGKEKRTLILDAIRELVGGDSPEEDFYKLTVARAMKPNDPASSTLMKELLVRLYPQAKPVMPTVEFEYPMEGSPAEKVEAIGNAIASGEVSADMGKIMVDIILAGVKIYEVTELADRLARIEEMLTSGQGA